MKIIIKFERSEMEEAIGLAQKIQEGLPEFAKKEIIMNIPDTLSGQKAKEVQTAFKLMTPYLLLEKV